MSDTVFFELEFLALLVCSIVLPIGVYIFAILTKSISRTTVLLLGITLIVLAGIDIVLLQRLADMARQSPSHIDDKIFASELSAALYLLPALFAGVGVNLVSHVLIRHLVEAEKRFEAAERASPGGSDLPGWKWSLVRASSRLRRRMEADWS